MVSFMWLVQGWQWWEWELCCHILHIDIIKLRQPKPHQAFVAFAPSQAPSLGTKSLTRIVVKYLHLKRSRECVGAFDVDRRKGTRRALTIGSTESSLALAA
ncbi:hypothetical protein ASG75_11000 [Rhodanobacter sp. Soil772]|nr:hypothetical protein ASG75_11000 [Rhodanobacter sp. Soil772]